MTRALSISLAIWALLAQIVTAQSVDVSFEVSKGIDPASMTVADCTQNGVSLNGKELVFSCPERAAYTVTLTKDGTTQTLLARPRQRAADDLLTRLSGSSLHVPHYEKQTKPAKATPRLSFAKTDKSDPLTRTALSFPTEPKKTVKSAALDLRPALPALLTFQQLACDRAISVVLSPDIVLTENTLEIPLTEVPHDTGTFEIRDATTLLASRDFQSLKDAHTTLVSLLKDTQDRLLMDLELKSDADIFALDRRITFYQDASCSTPFPEMSVDLANPGNRLPRVPACAYFRVEDQSRPASLCRPVEANPTQGTIIADVGNLECGPKRLAILVIENKSMNGAVGFAITKAMTQMSENLARLDTCAGVDVAQSVGASAKVTLFAEDMRLGSTPMPRFEFVNTTSEPLRDFDWVRRTWDDALTGLALVVDGDSIQLDDKRQSPQTMAWHIEGLHRLVMDVSTTNNCPRIAQMLLIENCVHVPDGNIGDALAGFIEEGLGHVSH